MRRLLKLILATSFVATTFASVNEASALEYHMRVEERVGDLRVMGGGSVVRYDGVNAPTRIRGSSVGIADVARTPRWSLADAKRVACRSSIGTACETELVVFAPANERAVLAYDVFRGDEHVMVDAVTGSIVATFDAVMSLQSTGIGASGEARALDVISTDEGLELTDTTRTSKGIATRTAAHGTRLPGSAIVRPVSDTMTWPASAVDAHHHVGQVFDFFRTTFGRKGIDGRDGGLVATVEFGNNVDNAFWDPNAHVLVFGDGGGGKLPPSAALDVVAHEFMHAITASESNLLYYGESGALNEAISDIFASFVEHSARPDAQKNFQCGEDLGFALRDMANPVAFQYPSHMSEYVRTSQDSGGVHINGSIPSLAMVLMTVGGIHPKTRATMQRGIGWENSLRVWYRLVEQYLVSSSSFADAADGTIAAARDLGLSAADVAVVECAWITVGVREGACRGAQGTLTPKTRTGDLPSLYITGSSGSGCAMAGGDTRHSSTDGGSFGGFAALAIAFVNRRRRQALASSSISMRRRRAARCCDQAAG